MTAVGHSLGRARTSARGGDALAARAAIALACAAIAAATVLRFVIGKGQPLWLDETWTGAIAATAGWGGFWRQVYLDVNAPLYYLVMHLWQGVAGLSNESLRLPSAVFGALAPLLIAFARVEGLSRPARLTWAALVALWIPGIWFSGDARCYALLLLLATAQTLAFVRLLRAPAAGRALAWCVLTGLAILTHYHAAILGAFQGLAYLALARGKAVRTWPAALVFVPVAAWLAWHAPRIALFAKPDVAWYPLLRWDRLGRVASYIPGDQTLGLALLAIAAVALVLGLMLNLKAERERRPTGVLWLAVLAAAIGAALVVTLGFIRPSFTDRYLIPFEPALLLGIVLVVQWLARRLPWTYAAVIVAAMAVVWPWAERDLRHGWRFYNWEVASNDLMKARPTTLVWLWDHPATPVMETSQLGPVGGFFFARAGHPVAVTSVQVGPGQDPNPILLRAAARPGSAILWAYDIGVRGTAAIGHRPNIEALDPSFKCRNYARGSVGVVACDRAGSVETRP
jgi:uncharacterized membrane protein